MELFIPVAAHFLPDVPENRLRSNLPKVLKNLGFPVGRLKTGTPPRLDGRTIDWDAFEPQSADENPVAFSFATEKIEQPQIQCFIGYTNQDLHKKIRDNLHQSPLYSGKIKGIGPRYCPSIEDKVVKFADKTAINFFLNLKVMIQMKFI